jgi:hypothetical protein
MFHPKRTFGSVAKELVNGLEDGTVTLHPEEPSEADVENFESMAIRSLAKHQRRLIAQLIGGNLCLFLGIYLLTGPELFDIASQPEGAGLRTIWAISLIVCVIGALSSFLLGLKSRERSIELKTVIRVLELADDTTAKRLVLWEGPRLRDRVLAP